MSESAPERIYGIRTSTAFVVGTVVGTGIYLKPSFLAQTMGATSHVLFLWFLGGCFATSGAVVYTRLARRWPLSGGPYQYLNRVYGPWAASLLSAADVFLARPAAVGALATGLGLIWGLSQQGCLSLAALLIVSLTAIQLAGSRTQGRSQILLTLLQLAPLLLLLILAFVFPSDKSVIVLESTGIESKWATGFLAVLWAFDGWYNVTILAGEVKDPGHTFQRSLIGGMIGVTLLYLALNAILWQELGPNAISRASLPFLELLNKWELPHLGAGIQVALSFALLGTLNGTLACGSRMIVAAAEDGLLNRRIGFNPTGLAPTLCFSLWCLGLLALFGGLETEQSLFDSLSEFTAVIVVTLSALTVSCVFRSKHFRLPLSVGVRACALFYLLISGLLLLLLISEQNLLALWGCAAVLILGTFLNMRRQG